MASETPTFLDVPGHNWQNDTDHDAQSLALDNPPTYEEYRRMQGSNLPCKYVQFDKQVLKGKSDGNIILSMEDMTVDQALNIRREFIEQRKIKPILQYLPMIFDATEYVRAMLNTQEYLNVSIHEWSLLDLFCHRHGTAIGLIFVKRERAGDAFREVSPLTLVYRMDHPNVIHSQQQWVLPGTRTIARVVNRVEKCTFL